MCIITIDRHKIRLLFDVLFVIVAFIDPEISPFYQCGDAPLVSILKSVLIKSTLHKHSLELLRIHFDMVTYMYDRVVLYQSLRQF